MNLKVAFALGCLTMSLYADEIVQEISQEIVWGKEPAAKTPKPPEKPVKEKVITCSYDCDLFSKDKKVLFFSTMPLK
jgi:hypothetical protein